MNSAPEISTGTRFDHYEVISQIGRGGMGEVWKARDTKLARFVAIKFIPPAWAAGSQAVERLRIEARAASALNHPNICTIYDFREYQGHPLIVMELMTGKTLRDRLSAGPLKTSETVEIGIQVAEALVAAHRRGIIHRDIKPENIFLTEDGPVKVLDFGLAKRFPQAMGIETTTSADSNALTSAGGAAGTISYMSPEQASGEELDGRTDLFSLGVVLYNCATGHPPFTGKTVGLVLSSILNRAPVPPISLNPDIPPRFQEVIFNCLEKDREFRYQSAEDLRAELKRVKRDLDLVHARSHGLAPDNDGGETSKSRWTSLNPLQDTNGTDTPWKARTARVGTVLIAVAVIAVGLTLWQLPPPPEETIAPDSFTEQPASVAETSLQLARASLAAGDYRAAFESARDALGESPDDVEATRILEEARTRIARFDEAVAETRRRLDAGDAEGAQESLEVARTIDPTAPVLAGLSSGLVDLLRQLNDAANARVEQSQAAAESTETAVVTVSPPPAPEPPAQEPPAAAPGPVPTRPLPDRTPTPEIAGPATSVSVPDATESEAPEEIATVDPEDLESDAATERVAGAERGTPAPAPAGDIDNEPSVDREADLAEIRRVVELYERALESKDLGLLRQVKPNLSPAEIASFTRGEAADVEISIREIVPDGDRAVVRVERRDDVGGGDPFEQALELVRTAEGWVIEVFAR